MEMSQGSTELLKILHQLLFNYLKCFIIFVKNIKNGFACRKDIKNLRFKE